MDIIVTFQKGEWKTEPDPAVAVTGTIVRWVVRATVIKNRRLRWKIIFKEKTPFPDRHEFIIETDNTFLRQDPKNVNQDFIKLLRQLGITGEEIVDHRGATPPVPVKDPDDYKYSLEVEDADTEEPIGEDDPRLIVLPPPPPLGSIRTYRM